MVKGKGKGVRRKRCLRSPIAIPRGGGNFDPCPEGDFNAVCVDVVDLGMVTSKGSWGEKTQPKVMLTFQMDALDEKGLPFLVFQRCTASLHEKAVLYGLLKKWFPKELSKVLPLVKKDVEFLLGKGARIEIVHNEASDGRTFANIDRIRPLAADQKAPQVHPDFCRKKDRTEGQGPFGKHTAKASDPDEGPADEDF